ncbi:hypothetical protein DAPPUDRAFT_305435 [Daphnia pulex]|uniref:Uncharacterized protein n=1 Tax=Daphnia pulex TaxID=6669 RepID=E9FWG9_DAPPU|nr:hypothetical protein DAPPUDRAFT_305435 [Daphnia pulex]|eukprot:EFX87890.1 hypothetical protein DAPPUDRAFT_305435 [Daphnia pulex]
MSPFRATRISVIVPTCCRYSRSINLFLNAFKLRSKFLFLFNLRLLPSQR